jgi:hypothetical protein
LAAVKITTMHHVITVGPKLCSEPPAGGSDMAAGCGLSVTPSEQREHEALEHVGEVFDE